MSRFVNTDGTLLALGAVALLAGAAVVRRRGSRSLVLRADAIEQVDIMLLADQVDEAWDGITYIPSEAELEALEWMGDRYSSTAYLLSRIRETTDKTIAARPLTVIDIDPTELRWALVEDGSSDLPGLNENLPIQRLVFLIAPHDQVKNEIEIVMALMEIGLTKEQGWDVVGELVQTAEGQRAISGWNETAEQRAFAVIRQYPHLIPQQVRRRIAAQWQ